MNNDMMGRSNRIGWLLCSVFLLLVASPLSAEWKWDWKESELRTVAYKAMTLNDLRWELMNWDEPDPFGVGTIKASDEPKRLPEAPGASRFFAKGDELWDARSMLVKLDLLPTKTKWAVFNKTRRQFVIRGDREVHGLFAQDWVHYLESLPTMIQVDTRLLKVPAPEVELVNWNEKLVRERKAEEVMAMGGVTRPGQTVDLELKMDGLSGSLEAKATTGSDVAFVGVGLNYQVTLVGGTAIDLKTELSFASGIPCYLELGSIDDPRNTYLLEVVGDLHFTDGTLRAEWREFEEGRHQPPRPVPYQRRNAVRKELGDEWILGIWSALPFVLDELSLDRDDAEPDPFGGDDTGLSGSGDERPKRFPLAKEPPDLPPAYKNELLLDVSEVMKKNGVEVPNEGWVFYEPVHSRFVSKLKKEASDQAERWREMIYDPPTQIKATVSLIAWNGAKIIGGRVPPDARRLGRAGMVVRPGQRASLTIGKKAEGKLVEGYSLSMAPNVGANREIFDLKLEYVQLGANHVKVKEKVLLRNNISLTSPIGKVDQRSRGIVVEAILVNARGEVTR